MDKDSPDPLGGWTVGTTTCLESEVKGKHLFRVEPGNFADHPLQQASELLASARRASFIGVMDDEPVRVWAAQSYPSGFTTTFLYGRFRAKVAGRTRLR